MKTQGKKKGTTLIVVGAAALFIVAFLLVCVGLSTEKYSLPQDYVEKNSKEGSNGMLVTNTIVRYAVRANVTPLNLSNRNLTVGVASQTDELNFGNVPKNITIRKFININNSEPGPVRVCIVKRGDIADRMFITQGDTMTIGGGGSREIELNFNSTEVRTYRGELDIVVRKPRYGLLKDLTSIIGC